MPSFSDWMRADIIAALALGVSLFAFLASAISAYASFQTYQNLEGDRQPQLRVYFEPFEDSDTWWIAHFEILNKSPYPLVLESISIQSPLFAKFSTFMGGYSGLAANNERMKYGLPEEVYSHPTKRKLKLVDLEGVVLDEYQPASRSVDVAEVLVRFPKFMQYYFNAHFSVAFREEAPQHRFRVFKLRAPVPNKKTTLSRS